MSYKNIEELLGDSKPVVKDDPTFMLKTLRNMEQVERIKGEVDRQRRHGRIAVLAALFLGLFAGILITAIAYLFPELTDTLKDGLHDILIVIPNDWKILLASLAILAITLGLVAPSRHWMRLFGDG